MNHLNKDIYRILSSITSKSKLVSSYITIVWTKIKRILEDKNLSGSEKVIKWVTQNRVCLTWYSTILTLVSSWDLGLTLYWIFLSIIMLPSLSWFSIWTLHAYIRTLEHIEKHGYLDKRFFKIFTQRDIDEKYSWYCELQWMYLASKAMNSKYPWVLEKFYEMKSQFTQNKIPNF